ncbi:peroxiredoxin-like family protein [Dokdonia sp. 4H-3-7-5]|uniref:peroxiredoxin-like family protein n=1 Tax=Dokdonia sp. (strain 4H-3-7-5) TaxID=983548 RepID=UPI00020A6304|nr:peroxiredoxin-like family protein [Dokdonia sp. 4H-3-7-5]AEE20564.1 alkyl hydroperoxide reductase/ Thiol specific antioxidant/ Mal allergen [Dokdonia sp. 4H-3-7-5]
MKLTVSLKELADNSIKRHPGAAQDIMRKAIEDLDATGILKHAVKTGDKFPDFTLPNAQGKTITLSKQLQKGKVVITFYRGGWCPYCNLELKAFQEVLPQIKEKGATLIAITPETPDNSLSTKEKNQLDFEVLTSENNELARSLNLVFKLPEALAELYGNFGIDLLESQGNDANELPIAATYIIDQNGEVSYHFLSEDYKLRADPEDIIAAL